LDKNRLPNNGAVYQVGLGYNFAPNVAAELDLSPNAFKIPGTGASEKLNALLIDVLYVFLPVTSVVRPYALVGGGRMRVRSGFFLRMHAADAVAKKKRRARSPPPHHQEKLVA
jgi:hypothetical protein